MTGPTRSIAYIAGMFPLRSETFVYRELRALRERGWNVTAVSLHDSADADLAELADLQPGRLIVYGSGRRHTLHNFLADALLHPIRSTATLLTAISDCLAPDERTSPRSRAKIIGAAIAAIGLARTLRARDITHVHCHFAHAPTTVGMYTALQLGVPFSFTGHANDLFQRRILLSRKLMRARFVACISRWHRDLYRSIVLRDDRAYPIIRCGVDVRGWATQNDRPPHALLNVLAVCRLVEKKGIDLLLRALETLAVPWHLTIAGDGPERSKLTALAAELNLVYKVEFAGAVNNDQVRNLLGNAHLFVLPCRTDSAGDRDGIPVVLMEAMACGVPVISGDLPAIRELVEPGVAGILTPPGEVAPLAQAIDRLARDVSLRDQLARAGRAAVEREFSLDANVTRLEQMIQPNLPISKNTAPEPAETSAPSRRYLLVTPCRDEAKYARRTLDSVVKQTILPALWLIVDDGSKDQTPTILAEYAAKYPFIRVIRREDRGFRKLGGGVIDAFYHGYDTINPRDFDYVTKLDLDLDLPPAYFEELMHRMEANPRIGTASGKPYFIDESTGKRISEKCGDENSVGMVKFYRTACFEQIGGFVRELMWDGIDCHRCRMLGWIAVSWPDPELAFEHLRPMGTSHKNWWTGRTRHGIGQYFMGTGITYMLASCLFRIAHPPAILGSTAMMWGYVKSMATRKERYGDKTFRQFLRRYQWACLLRGKSIATQQCNTRQAAAWNP